MLKYKVDLKDFKHKFQIRVRTFDVDSQGIVHNAVYLQYFEIGRVEYRRNLGYGINPDGIFNDGLKVVVVNNTINYYSPAYLDEMLNVYTRVAWIKNSSFSFDQLIENDNSKKILCSCKGILVNLDPSRNTPEKLRSKFIEEINNFETNLEIIKDVK